MGNFATMHVLHMYMYICMLMCLSACVSAIIFLFTAPVIGFEEVTYAVTENVEVQAVLILTGLSSINVTVQVSTTDGSAIGKHVLNDVLPQLYINV